MMNRENVRKTALLIGLMFFAVFGLWTTRANAQTEEIQVYTGEVAGVGVFNLTWHNNYRRAAKSHSPFPAALFLTTLTMAWRSGPMA